MKIVNLFKFVFITIGHPFVICVYTWFPGYFLPNKIFGHEAYYKANYNVERYNFVLFLLFALLFYAGWLVMLTCIFKIIKPKLNIGKFINEKLNFTSLNFFGCLYILVWFPLTTEANAFGFIFGLPMLILILLLICISFGMFWSNLINVLKGKYNYDYKPSINIKLVQKLGIDEIEIKSKLNRLYEIWWGTTAIIPESEEKMFITTLLEESLNDPIILSIIVDDATRFVKQFTKRWNKKGELYYFDFCCVCGAENIITKFFFENKDRKQCLLDSKDAIALAISSGNNNLVKQLATIAKELGKKDLGPLELYSAGNSSGIDIVSKIFSDLKR